SFGRQMCGAGPGIMMFRQNDKLAETLKLTDAEQAKYEDFKAASRATSETMQNTCDANLGSTMPNRMEGMETRMAAMLTAMRTVRPALDAFYASLTEAQKAQFDSRSGTQ
ncbi:MAG: Spy/CpxP family protein refolding chaperone, partial [Afipia sp.]|nr:Spy/CpxP family protein refolding chaperone [Afipia sp.]